MANWLSQQKGKANNLITNLTLDGSSVLTSELNKLWRAKILLNRLTSDLPKDTPVKGKSSIPNYGESPYSNNPLIRNPKVNQEEKQIARNSGSFLLANRRFLIEHNKPNKNEYLLGTNPVSLKEPLDQHNRSKNKIIIFNLSGRGKYQRIILQNRPSQLDFRGETSWAAIKSMGRNTPMYHYTGSEDTVQFNISWFCNDPNNYEEVIAKCRLLESWSKSDGYAAGPPVLRIDWGGEEGSGLFKDTTFILHSATYTLMNFQSGHLDRRPDTIKTVNDLKDTKLYPMAATQELVFKRVSSHNLTHADIVSESTLSKTKGIS